MQNISKHCTYKEATRSITAMRRGIDNDPNANALSNMHLVAQEVFEPLRQYYNMPIYISSFYRSFRLNKAIGGSDDSQHIKGQAMDLDADVFNALSNADIFYHIKNNLLFDQLIWEFGDNEEPDWVHVSFCQTGNRQQVLKSYRLKTGAIKYMYL